MYKNKILLLLLTIFLAFSCAQKTASSDEHDELAEDQAELDEAYRNQSKIQNQVFADVETEPIAAGTEEDAADDPAIWYNNAMPSESLIFGSNKKGGIVTYTLKGEKVDYYPVGNVNNVDIIYDFPFDDRTISVLGCSNRSTQGIDIFEITEDGSLVDLSEDRFLIDTTILDDVYGFCFGVSTAGQHYAFVNGKNGLMRQYEMVSTDGVIELEMVRELKFDSQPEGMVTSDKNQQLYVGEEEKGIWLLDLDPGSTSKTLLPDSGEGNEYITYDVEGLTILKTSANEWLIASSQGNFSYAVFDISNDHKYLGSFVIADGDTIDGAEETDGIDVITDSLSTEFPKGIFIAQDGFNFVKASKEAQNFKYVDVRQVLGVFE